MSAPHKSENPAATGLYATYQNTPADDTLDAQRLTNLICAFRVRGHAVHRLERGFIVSKFGLARHCQDFSELVRFARIVGAVE